MNTERLPGYIELYRSGELGRRAEALEARLAACDICPLKCGIDRLKEERGFCRSGYRPAISSCCAHHGEEPALSGARGSGTIFLGNCNMRCVYCQNFQISQDPDTQKLNEADYHKLAQKMLYLQNDLRCHNINLVSPSHYVPQIVRALLEAVSEGLHLPLVYNTGGYDSPDTIRMLEGIVDIYLPDIRYSADSIGLKYSGVPDYVKNNRQAIKEMYRQVGGLKVDENEIAYRGMIVRHLILPEGLAGSEESLTWLAREVSQDITVSIMSQYHPCHLAVRRPELARTITYEEYSAAANLLEKLGLENGWLQEMDAPANYLPDFSRDGHPFE
ncbi:MAG: radical SAM protein [Dehalococcoidales bacterium]|nr:radical SAM protein [Dehalococcoidales bacterium]